MIVDNIRYLRNPKVAMIGLQPAILAQSSSELRCLVDLDPDNIGSKVEY